MKDFYLQAKSLMHVLNDESSRLRSQIAVLMETVDEQYGDLVDQFQPTFKQDYAKLKHDING
jgi:predicted  nucleic acid-binding Zn-ribbon protein